MNEENDKNIQNQQEQKEVKTLSNLASGDTKQTPDISANIIERSGTEFADNHPADNQSQHKSKPVLTAINQEMKNERRK